MSLTENGNGFTMPVTPMGYGNGGFGNGFGGEGWWILLLILFAGGWNNNGWGGNGGPMDAMYPWLVNNTNQGFDQAATAASLAGIQTSLTNGFSNAEVAACNRAMSEMQTAFTNQIASMNQSFANSQALDSRLDAISQNQATCCCQTQAAIKDVAYNVATEACADRAAVSNALRDVLEANNAATQKILDVMCQDKIDAKNERIADLQNQLAMAQLAASQNAQTAAIIANNEAQTAALESYLQPPVRPCYVVPNPNCCGQNYYGCGVA